jgi:hypothetical protein
MRGTAADTFTVEAFTWADGVFDLRGSWSPDAAGLGRVRLLVDVDGRRRNIGAQGGKTAGGDEWRARFMCAQPPGPSASAALKVGDAELPLPAPELRAPPASEEVVAAATAPASGDALLEELRAARPRRPSSG